MYRIIAALSLSLSSLSAHVTATENNQSTTNIVINTSNETEDTLSYAFQLADGFEMIPNSAFQYREGNQSIYCSIEYAPVTVLPTSENGTFKQARISLLVSSYEDNTVRFFLNDSCEYQRIISNGDVEIDREVREFRFWHFDNQAIDLSVPPVFNLYDATKGEITFFKKK